MLGGLIMAKRANFSVDEKVLESFRKVCKENYINQSAIITATMKEIIEKYSKEDKR